MADQDAVFACRQIPQRNRAVCTAARQPLTIGTPGQHRDVWRVDLLKGIEGGGVKLDAQTSPNRYRLPIGTPGEGARQTAAR